MSKTLPTRLCRVLRDDASPPDVLESDVRSLISILVLAGHILLSPAAIAEEQGVVGYDVVAAASDILVPRLATDVDVESIKARGCITLAYVAAELVDISAPDNGLQFDNVARGEGEMTAQDYEAMQRIMHGFWISPVSLSTRLIVALALFVLIASAVLYLAPAVSEWLRLNTISAPIRNTAVGALVLGALLGLVLVCALGGVAIPLFIVPMGTVLTAGYLVGIYAIAWEVATGVGQHSQTLTRRVAVVTIGLAAGTALTLVPFLGSIANFAVVLLGLGGIASCLTAFLASRVTA